MIYNFDSAFKCCNANVVALKIQMLFYFLLVYNQLVAVARAIVSATVYSPLLGFVALYGLQQLNINPGVPTGVPFTAVSPNEIRPQSTGSGRG